MLITNELADLIAAQFADDNNEDYIIIDEPKVQTTVYDKGVDVYLAQFDGDSLEIRRAALEWWTEDALRNVNVS